MVKLALLAHIVLFFAPSFVASAATTVVNKPVKVTEGFVSWTSSDGGGPYQTFFKLFGQITPASPTPLIVLHGGPGLSLDYMTPFQDLATQHNIPVILYDQLGNAHSTHLDSALPSFWNIDIFVEELSNVISHFNIQRSFSIAGHSWGTVLAMEFAQRLQPAGLKRLILSDGLASNDLWNESQGEQAQEFPLSVQEGLAAGFSDPVAFKAAFDEFNTVHGIRLNPLPADWLATEAWIFGPNADVTVANASQILDGWTIIDRLSTINVPKTLVINGEFDTAQDFVIEPLFTQIPRAKHVKFRNASHTPFLEQRERYFQVVSEFLLV